MKVKHLLIINILLLLILSSCKKEVIEEITASVFAGIYNDSMIYHEFNPPFQLQLQTDTLKNTQFGIDSIDIDLDGIFDIYVMQRIYLDWTDDFNRNFLDKDDFPFIGFRLKNGFEIAFKSIQFPTGLGTTGSVAMVDTIIPDTGLHKITDWLNSDSGFINYLGYSNNSVWMWGAPPASYWMFGSYGPWYDLVNRYMYVGIRKNIGKNNKLGWIKVYVHSRDEFEIISYAIEN